MDNIIIVVQLREVYSTGREWNGAGCDAVSNNQSTLGGKGWMGLAERCFLDSLHLICWAGECNLETRIISNFLYYNNISTALYHIYHILYSMYNVIVKRETFTTMPVLSYATKHI